MSTLLQQLAYQYETDKSGIDSTSGVAMVLRQEQQKQMLEDQLKSGRGSSAQLDQYEREQHLHQLQSMSNLLLEMPSPSPSSPTSPSYAGTRLPELPSPTNKTQNPQNPQNLNNMSLSELFGLGITRGSLVNAGQKEQGGPTNYDSPAYRNFQQHDNMSNFYSNLSSGEIPSSPSSIHTPASPGTPGSLYSNPYSYSSVNSSPYNSTSTGSTNYKKQYSRSPVGSPCYGRPIRGSTPYSECNSPSMEFPPHVFNCNGSRSDSPADSDNSAGSLDNSVSDIMSNLFLNPGHRCYPNAIMEVENYLQNGRTPLELQKLKKYLHNNQQQQQHQSPRSSANHVHHYHAHGHSRNNNYANQACDNEKSCCLVTTKNAPTPMHYYLDKAARFHRNAAAASDANYTWSGTLPQRTQKPIGYSSKVFLGGVPWDITESTLISTFKQFGQIKIEWPGKDQAASRPKGYVYIVFESEKQVKALLSCCTHDFSNGGSYYYKISSKRMKGKDVQVIPWALNDSNYVKSSSQKLDAAKTVFVGALHGMMTATVLATIMNDLFDNVIYAGIDTDKHRYPIGSARITFCSKQSFNKAVNAAFIEVKTSKFNKKIQVDPYIEEAPCSSCYVQQGPYFCREQVCFKYYCHTCWQWAHNNESMSWHKPMSRGLKNNQVIGLTPNARSGRFSSLM